HRDGAAVAEEGYQEGKADRRFGRRDGEHEKREDLADQIAQHRGEGDEVQVHGKQDEFDRHQNDDDVLAIEENAEDAEREKDGGDGEIMCDADFHSQIPSPVSTLRISMAVAGVRATCAAMLWRFTLGL